jgi:hypothetical protein
MPRKELKELRRKKDKIPKIDSAKRMEYSADY